MPSASRRASASGSGRGSGSNAASGSRRPTWLPQATVFISSFCIMVIELVAGRVISRHLGSSLYTWTSVIGVVLAGIAVGNWLGGRMADRRKPLPLLSTLFLVSSILCLSVTILNHQVGEWVFLWMLPWPVRVGAHVSVVFLAPSLALGMISPVAAKMALDHSTQTGRTIGSVYAWGVVGSIAGTFATGFYLIAAFGTGAVVWAVAGTLALMAALFGAASWRGWTWIGLLAGLAVVGTGPWAWAKTMGETLLLRETFGEEVLYVDDSQYSHIQVHRMPGEADRRYMLLDKLLHSTIDMQNPTDLQYAYERIYGAITRRVAADRDVLNTLTIGGGGYVFPRYLDETWPGSTTDVVEIDPAVTRAAIVAMGLPAKHGLAVFHEDGRVFLRRRAEALRQGETVPLYDFIYLDVFNDYSVPYQLTTVECLEIAEELLAPDGAFLMNMIDVFEEGRFLGSMIQTMGSVFDEVVVLVEGAWPLRPAGVRDTFILAGSNQPIDIQSILSGYDRERGLHRLTAAELAGLRTRCEQRILTDDWAPIENMLAPVVRSSSRELAADLLVRRGEAAFEARDVESTIRNAERSLKFAPANQSAHQLLANAHFIQGHHAKAIHHYEVVLAARPGLASARNNYGAALLKSGRLDEAVQQFQATLQIDPNHQRAQENLERAHRRLAKTQ